MINSFIPSPDITMVFPELEPSMDYKLTVSKDGTNMQVWYRDTSELSWEETNDPEDIWKAWVLYHYHDEPSMDTNLLTKCTSMCRGFGYIPSSWELMRAALYGEFSQ